MSNFEGVFSVIFAQISTFFINIQIIFICHITCSGSYCKKEKGSFFSYNDLNIQIHIFSLLLSA